jgi:hypothetical protein
MLNLSAKKNSFGIPQKSKRIADRSKEKFRLTAANLVIRPPELDDGGILWQAFNQRSVS